MFAKNWKAWLVGMALVAMLLGGTSQAQAFGGWGCGWGGCWGGCYSSCYTPCYTVCCTPCYTSCYTPCCSPCYSGWGYGCYRPRFRSCGYRSCYTSCCYSCGYDPCCCEDACGWEDSCCGGESYTTVNSTPVVEDPTPAPKAPAEPKEPPVAPKEAPPLPPSDTTVPGLDYDMPRSVPGLEPEPGLPRPTSKVNTRKNSGLLTIYVPYDARVTINGLATKTKGSRREYVSYGLKPGFSYKYEVRAEVVRDGETVSDVRTVVLTAGGREAVAFGFNSDATEGLAASW